jgi:hypothetical protein
LEAELICDRLPTSVITSASAISEGEISNNLHYKGSVIEAWLQLTLGIIRPAG